jgi:hypothetical protein
MIAFRKIRPPHLTGFSVPFSAFFELAKVAGCSSVRRCYIVEFSRRRNWYRFLELGGRGLSFEPPSMGRAHQESSLLRLFSICRTISLFSACLQGLPTFILTRFVWPCDRRLTPSLKFMSFFIGSIESLAFNYLVGFGNLARVNGD